MDTRINPGERFSTQGREYELMGSWVPATPEKPNQTIDRHGHHQLGRVNWQELPGLPNGYVQEMSKIEQKGRNGSSAERNRMINHIAGSYSQALSQEIESWNGSSFVDLLTTNYAPPFDYSDTSLNGSMSVVGRPLIPDYHSQVTSLREFSSREMLFPNQTHCSSSSLSSGHSSLLHMSEYGFPMPCNPNFDLNSRQSVEADSASTATNSFQFAPETPQSNRWKNLSATVNSEQEKVSREGINKCPDLVPSVDYIPKQHNSDQHLHNILDSSSAVISTLFEEPKDSGKQIDQVIDLNQTPQQKTQKRKKHRPKVVKEGKKNITPKSATSKIADPNIKTTEKRKYVRRKGQQELPAQHPGFIGGTIDSKETLKERKSNVNKEAMKDSSTQNADDISEKMNPSAGIAAPSCRRALNFDHLENIGDEVESNLVAQQEILKKKEAFSSHTGFQAAESVNKTNMMCRTKSGLQIRQQNEPLLENQETGAISNFTSHRSRLLYNDTSISNRIEAGSISISDGREAEVQLASEKEMQMDNLNANARETEIRMQHLHAEGIGQTAFPEKFNCIGLEGTRQLMHQNTQSVGDISHHLIHGSGNKRKFGHVEQTSYCTANPPDYDLNSCMFSTDYSETNKKRKIENGILMDTNGMIHSIAAINHSIASTAQKNREIFNSYLDSNNIKRKKNNAFVRFPVDCYTNQVPSAQDLLNAEAIRSTYVQNLASLTTVENYNMLPPSPLKTGHQPEGQLQVKTYNINVSKQAMEHTRSKSIPQREGYMLQAHVDILKDQQLPAKRRGRPQKQSVSTTIEEIIYRMECLNLNKRGNEMKGKEQNALVPYKGDGTLISYGGFDFIKKRKPRPKVDIDPETERMWKLLMWEEGSEGVQGTDEEKRQWWEEERRVFRGRADSFIAKMHLVQGDRRFSKWKGSVVDSVIGVFLTQNVSDHLSSSAFMSLAARFPLKSARNRTHERDGTRILIEELDAHTLNPNDIIKWDENILHHPFYNQNSMASYEQTEYQRDCENSWTVRTSIVEAHSNSPQEEVLSSQDYFDSPIIHSNGVRSYSGSNSEAEDHANGCKHSRKLDTTSINLPQVESTTLFDEFYSLVSGRSLSHIHSRHEQKHTHDTENRQQQRPILERLDTSFKGPSAYNQQINYNNPHTQVLVVPSSKYQLCRTVHSGIHEADSVELNREESIASWPSGASRLKEKDASCTSKRVVQGAESVAIPTAQLGLSSYQETRIGDPHLFLSKQMIYQQSNIEPYHGSQPHKVKAFQLERKSMVATAHHADAQANGQSAYRQHNSNIPSLTRKAFDVEERIALQDKQTHPENEIVESNLEKVHLTNRENSKTNYLKARKAKAPGEKKDENDWDSLRKQVLANGRTKDRSQDTMDSMDYEAMRCAAVNEISDTIKERGMNNMLAERIQEFLNRLVHQHGSIDLEWLRDIPPDRAKDYLLSIRGLGLKSVECVRLLTLHHLAFPVDTNVGRIAVRLGWVPLQPLPESLQLHLLELYPILESIQKYLWPRLCKLDQRTLYELHYQLITFGKVFCTKNKPNCNACPMRAECRHFASAFASARLALPGPEERSMVTSTVPLRTERSPGIVIDPMPLPPSEENSIKRAGSDIVSCVPIIEEPATPEQEHNEVAESDIEDINNEDTDEIPTIKLNMEELTINLHNYMQANMELQDCDMSKALVALNPEAASIPTPKLKNVSRLRTEHQVYELPDSHPLLKEIDRREPDDPSPYLLAIWTPGETANSVQPPEQNCQSQEPDKLCNEKTCFSCNSIREANSQTVRGTLLIPCRTAMRGSFPLNGTYFQVNEIFADHETSLNPINVPRAWIWNLPRRAVYFGTSVSTIFKGLSTGGIQYCFWKGFVCVRGFDQRTRAPKPLIARLHFPASKLAKANNRTL